VLLCQRFGTPFLRKKIQIYLKGAVILHQLDVLHPQGWLYFNVPRNQLAMFGEDILKPWNLKAESKSRLSECTYPRQSGRGSQAA